MANGFYTGVFNATKTPAALEQKSFAASMMRFFPNGSAPLLGLTSMTGTTKAKQIQHGYFSKTVQFITLNLAGGVTDDATTLTFASTNGLLPGTLLHNLATRETVRITAITSATAVTVTRAFGRVAADAMTTAQDIIQVGSAFEQGSARPSPKAFKVVHITNYTQIIRNAWALTDTARATLMEVGFNNLNENKRDCGLMHGIEKEQALIWGQPYLDTSGAQPIHATQGIIDAIEQYAPQNVETANATTSYEELVDMVENAFQVSTDMGDPRTRVAVGDSQAIKVLHEIGRKSGQVNIMQSETAFGMQFDSFKFYKGKLNLIEHPLFNGMGIAGTLLILDIPSIKLAYMEGRNAKEELYGVGGNHANDAGTVATGVDAQGGSLTSEFAVEHVNPYSCGIIRGLTKGVEDADD